MASSDILIHTYIYIYIQFMYDAMTSANFTQMLHAV